MLRRLRLVAVWLLLAVPTWFGLFLYSHDPMVIASHDAVVTPTFDHYARVTMGPYLPDLRRRSDSQVGVRIELGKTRALSERELIERYALLGTHSNAEVRRVGAKVRDQAADAAFQAAVLAAVPVALWVLLGSARRRELLRPTRPKALIAIGTVGVVTLAVLLPWRPSTERVQTTVWIPLEIALPDVTIPAELGGIEVQGGLLTQGTRRLISSVFQGFSEGKEFYDALVEKAPDAASRLRKPLLGQSVAVLVSDRHDNIGMDEVVRAVADGVGATAILNAGDDTSTGEPWEAFSLDSLDDAFSDYRDRITVAGNHDHGDFVSKYLKKRGWTHPDGEASAHLGMSLLGVDDPRSSGLGIWKDEKGLSFAEVESRIAEDLCARNERGERIVTLLVHDRNLGRTALARGCVDLVLAGHTHVQIGPDRVVGENGSVGYSYVNGTTGGAAFAVAVGSRLRREAQFTFITFADGRPVGLQPVRISTRGAFLVDEFIALDYGAEGNNPD